MLHHLAQKHEMSQDDSRNVSTRSVEAGGIVKTMAETLGELGEHHRGTNTKQRSQYQKTKAKDQIKVSTHMQESRERLRARQEQAGRRLQDGKTARRYLADHIGVHASMAGVLHRRMHNASVTAHRSLMSLDRAATKSNNRASLGRGGPQRPKVSSWQSMVRP